MKREKSRRNETHRRSRRLEELDYHRSIVRHIIKGEMQVGLICFML